MTENGWDNEGKSFFSATNPRGFSTSLEQDGLCLPYFLQLTHGCFLLSPPPFTQRQCGQWFPMLMVVIATALAVFLANKNNLLI
jgi:hypothetical protein